MSYFLYILRDNNNYLYIGQTNNLNARLGVQEKKSSKSAKYIQDNGTFQLVYKEVYSTRLESMRREHQLKGWTRAKKEALIKGDLALLKKL